MTNPNYQPPRRPFLERIGKPLGIIALVVVLLSIGWCGVTQTDIYKHKEGWSAVIMIAFILVGLGLVTGVIHWHRTKKPS